MTKLFEDEPFIIAEVGSNWRTLDDCLDDCLESIRVAKECGADAVKFQLFDSETMYGCSRYLYGIPGMGGSMGYCVLWKNETADITELKRRVSQDCGFSVEKGWFWKNTFPHGISVDWLPTLKAECDRVGIEFMCTAFSPELVAAVDPYVEVHKVASSDAAWPQMLDAVARTGKPVLVSTGAKKPWEIGAAQKIIGPKAMFLHCVSAYPADFAHPCQAQLLSDHTLGSLGFSDHTLGYSAAVVAAMCGASVIEKHFTAFPDLDTPDRPHSLTPKQFKRMVDIIRGREVESEETAMFLRHNRRLIATQDITAGAVLEYGVNFGAYRSLVDDTRGLSPFEWERVQGSAAKIDISRGVSIGEGDFA